jgi:hypothetical protein
MSTHVVGFVPPDEQWKQLKAVHDACTAAGIEVPSEVEMVIGSNPTEHGREVDIVDVEEWYSTGREGYDVDVSKLPPGVTVIRFYNSW